MNVRKIVYRFLLLHLSFGAFASTNCCGDFTQITEASTSPDRFGVDDIRSTVAKMLENQKGADTNGSDITSSQIEAAFDSIIQKVDPDKIYYLQSEVAQFLNPKRVQKALAEYHKGSFATFNELLKQIQQVIERAREWRLGVQWEENTSTRSEDKHTSSIYSSSITDLRMRHVNHFLVAVFDTKPSHKEFRAACRRVDQSWRDREDHYLLQGSETQKEEQFAEIILKALSSTFDAHSTALTHQEADFMRLRLEKETVGIGLFFTEAGGVVRISYIVKGSPAAQEKSLKVGDQVLSINKREVKGLTLQQVEQLLPKKPGETIIVEARRGSRPITAVVKSQYYQVEEGRLEVSTVSYKDGDILVLTLPSFYGGEGDITATKEIRKAIEARRGKSKLLGIILDLRINRGGFLAEAVTTSGLFIDTGVVVATKNAKGEVRYFRDVSPGTIFRGPFIILTSRVTASAAEIVAESLKEYGIALIVGDKATYGKGSVQLQNAAGVTDEQKTKGDGAGFKVTVGTYHTPSGHSPQLEGVKADIVVPSPWAFDARMSEGKLTGTIEAQDIPAAFNDGLQDVPLTDKTWFERFYLPHLEKQKSLDKALLSYLGSESAKRLDENVSYQLYLQKMKADDPMSEEDQRKVLDLQRDEGIAILCDWIRYRG